MYLWFWYCTACKYTSDRMYKDKISCKSSLAIHNMDHHSCRKTKVGIIASIPACVTQYANYEDMVNVVEDEQGEVSYNIHKSF